VAEDGRVVPVIIESDLPMSKERYVKGVHLIVDHNPDAPLGCGPFWRPTPVKCGPATRGCLSRSTGADDD
jgi:predicted secreted protein